MPDSSQMLTHASTDAVSHSAELGELAAALAKAQADIVGAVKDSANPFFKSSYADLASVWAACRKPLSANALAVVQLPVMIHGGVGVTTMLIHSSGQWVAGTATASPKDMGPQAIGSVITYLRRYALAAVAGVSQIDDDANAGEGRQMTPHVDRAPVDPMSEIPDRDDDFMRPTSAAPVLPPKPSNGGATISEAQGKRLWAIAKGKNWSEDQLRTLYAQCGIVHSRDIKRADYDDIIAAIEAGPITGGQ
jgi:hypothetical protein